MLTKILDCFLPPTLYVRIFPLSAIYIKRPFTVFAVKRSDIHLLKVVLTCAAPFWDAAENEKRENMEN